MAAAANAAAVAARAAGGGAVGAAAAAAVAAGSSRGVVSPSSLMLHALRLDWGSLQMRFWPAAVADALLDLVDGGKGVVLAEDECLRPFVSNWGVGGESDRFGVLSDTPVVNTLWFAGDDR